MIYKLRTTNYLFIFLVVVFSSCVSTKRFNELDTRYQRGVQENERLRYELETTSRLNERLSLQMAMLREDTTRLGIQLRQTALNLEQLQTTYNQVVEYNQRILEGREEETRTILTRLQGAQEDLQRREDELKANTAILEAKQKDLEQLMAEMQQKELRLGELESILNRQDSVVGALRNSVSAALLGFQGNGLSVEVRNGKVYVSLEESLLFATGSTVVDARGERALRELARVLEQNPDINIMVEGHTDNVPLRSGSLMKDNWDLSVLRATSILRILLNNGQIDPQRILAAGRGEFMPVEEGNTPEARRKNRRTEIILTPRLDELFRIIETN